MTDCTHIYIDGTGVEISVCGVYIAEYKITSAIYLTLLHPIV